MNGANCADCGKATPQREPHLLCRADIQRLLPPRPRTSQKGDHGRALLCVGSARYTGAALLSAGAALRVGCGVLEAAVPGRVKEAFCALPEVCCTAVNDGGDWDAAGIEHAVLRIPGKRALGIGCGMGELANARLLEAALESGLPLVLDADALNFMSQRRTLFSLLHPNVVLTPHPGEMARLLDAAIQDVLSNPAQTAQEAAAAWNCTVLLKGADTFLSDGTRWMLNRTGNPGLAKGGSGDVLTGLITGLLAQGLAPFDAACAGAYLLGASADTALNLFGNRMLIARDVIGAVRMTLEQEL